MGIDFVWEVHDDEEEAVVPPPAAFYHPPVLTLYDRDGQVERRRQRSWRRLAPVACLLLAALTGAGVYVSDTANRNWRLAQADLLAVIQTEARALANGDVTLYHSLQSPTNAGDRATLASQRFDAEQRLAHDSALRIVDMAWQGDHADVWAGYTEDGIAYVRLQGYRQVEGRWLRTDVDRRWWGAAHTLQTAHFRFEYHEAEAGVVVFLAPWAEALYANLAFGPRRTSEPIIVRLHPYLRWPLAWVGRRQVALTSPLLVGVSLEALQHAPSPDTLVGLSFAPDVGQELLADIAAANPTWAVHFFSAVALAVANDVTDAGLHSDRVYWFMAEVAARYEVEQLLPALAKQDEEVPALRGGSALPLSALWTDAIVMVSAEDCNDLASIERPLGACYGRGEEDFHQALAQARSLIVFAEEWAAARTVGVPAERFPLVGRFLAAIGVGDVATAIRYLWQEVAQDASGANLKAVRFYEEPGEFVTAWHAWLQERYR